MKVAVYARVSTAEQNPDTQLTILRDYCRSRGWEIAGEYIDQGVSGAASSRPQLDELMRDATRLQFKAVLVWKFDRFARSVQHLLTALRHFQSLGIEFVSLTEAIDTTTPIGKMVFTFLGAIAEFERDLMRERTLAGVAHARASGKQIGRPRVAVDLPKLLQLKARGLSYRQIARETGYSLGLVFDKLAEAFEKAAHNM